MSPRALGSTRISRPHWPPGPHLHEFVWPADALGRGVVTGGCCYPVLGGRAWRRTRLARACVTAPWAAFIQGPAAVRTRVRNRGCQSARLNIAQAPSSSPTIATFIHMLGLTTCAGVRPTSPLLPAMVSLNVSERLPPHPPLRLVTIRPRRPRAGPALAANRHARGQVNTGESPANPARIRAGQRAGAAAWRIHCRQLTRLDFRPPSRDSGGIGRQAEPAASKPPSGTGSATLFGIAAPSPGGTCLDE
jgi:hypothetical protein